MRRDTFIYNGAIMAIADIDVILSDPILLKALIRDIQG
jgi:hypothetical protein